MRIGIDVDDTITDSWNGLIPYYSRLFNIDEETLKKSQPYYGSVKDIITLDDYFKVIVPVYDEAIPKVKLKPDVKETIDALVADGHEIIFITARGKGHSSPYEITKNYLDNYQIKYDKIIINAHDKDEVCQQENIDLFIDDSIRNCTAVSNKGIETLLFDNHYNQKNTTLKRVKTWKEVYNYIKSR